MPAFDPYVILGVTADASSDDLLRAFRELVRQHHPDTRRPDTRRPAEPDSDADVRLRQILAAYDILRDPARRAAYDRAHVRQPPPPQAVSIQVRPAATRAGPWTTRRPSAIRVGPVRWRPLPPDRG
ncbi:J domain-containing protein [Kribbella swartbergensis]